MKKCFLMLDDALYWRIKKSGYSVKDCIRVGMGFKLLLRAILTPAEYDTEKLNNSICENKEKMA